jgi:hypothetical protein
MERFDHFCVKWREDCRPGLNNRHGVTAVAQVFCHLDSDESGTEDDDIAGRTRDRRDDSVGVGDVSKGERTFPARNVKSARRGSRRQDE